MSEQSKKVEYIITYQTSDMAKPNLWTFLKCETLEEAVEAMGNCKNELIAEGIDLYIERAKTFRVSTWEDYEQSERNYWLGGKLVLTTKEQYWEMLEVLPPNNWGHHFGVESFTMSERTTATYTTQFATIKHEGEEYFACRTVDDTDKSTWITRDEFINAINNQESN